MLIGHYLVLDTDAEAVINAIQATGATLTLAQKKACNDRVAAMKNDGTWTKRLAYYGFLGGTAAAHAINWKSPGTYNITWSGTISHDANGVLSSGGHGDTGLTESLFIATSTHMALYSRIDRPAASEREFGNLSGTDSFEFIVKYGGNAAYYRSFASGSAIEGSSVSYATTGWFVGVREASTGKLFRNGSLVVSATGNGSTATKTGNIGILRSSYLNEYTRKQLASAALGQALSDAEVSADYTSEQAYQAALGRQV